MNIMTTVLSITLTLSLPVALVGTLVFFAMIIFSMTMCTISVMAYVIYLVYNGEVTSTIKPMIGQILFITGYSTCSVGLVYLLR